MKLIGGEFKIALQGPKIGTRKIEVTIPRVLSPHRLASELDALSINFPQSRWRELNPRIQFGRLVHGHYATPAKLIYKDSNLNLVVQGHAGCHYPIDHCVIVP